MKAPLVEISRNPIHPLNQSICIAGGGGPLFEFADPYVCGESAIVFQEFQRQKRHYLRVHKDCGASGLQHYGDKNFWADNLPFMNVMHVDDLGNGHHEPRGLIFTIASPIAAREWRCMDIRYPENEGLYVVNFGNMKRGVQQFAEFVGIDKNGQKRIANSMKDLTVEAVRKLIDPKFQLPMFDRVLF